MILGFMIHSGLDTLQALLLMLMILHGPQILSVLAEIWLRWRGRSRRPCIRLPK